MLDKYALDSAGIFPYRHESEINYVARGNGLIENYDENITYALAFNKFANAERIVEDKRIECAARLLCADYAMDLSWINVYYFRDRPANKRYLKGVAYREFFFNGRFIPPLIVLSKDAQDYVIIHEMVHYARFPIFPLNTSNPSKHFEEAMASLHFSVWQKFLLRKNIKKEMKVIKKAGRNLEKILTHDYKKLLIRLTRWEIYLLAESFSKFYCYIQKNAAAECENPEKENKRVRFSLLMDRYMGALPDLA